MDSKNRNKSDEQIRDEAIARRAGGVLSRSSPQHDSECPDAERIAAYFERVLKTTEIAQCESHFASCSRCRETLAMLAATMDEPVAATGAVRDAGGSDKPQPASRKQFDWRVRWLAPALGMAAVVIAWFAVRPPWGTGDRNSSPTLIAQAPQSAAPAFPPASPRDQSPAPAAKQKSEPRTAVETDRAIVDSPAKTRPATVENESHATAPVGEKKDAVKSKNADAALPQVPTANGGAPQAEPQAAGRTIGGLTAPTPASRTTGAIGGTPDAVAQLNAPKAREKVDAVTQAPNSAAPSSAADLKDPAPSAANLPLNGRNFSTLALQKAPAQSAIVLTVPGTKTQWRAGVRGRIERSLDAGRTWSAQASPSTEDWLAGAAVSERVAWLVGRKGAIARTTDGEHWASVGPPSVDQLGTDMPPDWTAARATDAQSVTITSADQHNYVTQDGGKTWRAQ